MQRISNYYCRRFFGVIPLRMTNVAIAWKGILPPLRSSEWHRLLLGMRIFGAIHLRMTYFLTRDSSRQISCYYCLAWDSSLHDRFVQNDGQMSFRANARNPPILPFCLRYFVLFANDAGFSVGFFLFAVINMIIRWQSIKQRRGYLHLCKQPLFSLRIHLK